MTETIRPRSLRLEASTICQLKCPACETAQGLTKETLGGGFLKFKDFQRLVDDNPWLSHIELSNWGEIFLNPELPDIVEYAYRKNVALTAQNGVNLNTVKDQTLEAVVKYKFRFLNCSIDGASQEIYSIYRRGGNFDRVIENIKKINHYKSLYRSEFPILRWQFIAFGHNEHQILEAREMAKSLNMKFYVKLNFEESYSPVKNKDFVRKEGGVGAASRSEYYEKYGTNYLQKHICAQLWKTPQVNWDGRILGCCRNYWGDFGNVFESDVASGLNNDKINYARQMLLGKAEAKEGIPCTTCSAYKKMQETGDLLTPSDVTPSKGEQLLTRLGRLGVWATNRSPFAAKMYVKFFGNL